MNEIKRAAISELIQTSFKSRMVRQWQEGSAVNPPQVNDREFLILEIAQQYGPLTEAQLAKILGLVPSSTSDVVKKMMEKGLVAKKTGGADARQRPFALTEAGLGLLMKIRTKMEERADYLLVGLDEAKMEAALQIFQGMHKNADKRVKEDILNWTES